MAFDSLSSVWALGTADDMHLENTEAPAHSDNVEEAHRTLLVFGAALKSRDVSSEGFVSRNVTLIACPLISYSASMLSEVADLIEAAMSK